MGDENREPNPYSPPAELALPQLVGGVRVSDFTRERRSVVVCVALSVITVGLYQAVWLLRRAPFLDRLNASEQLGSGLPIFLLVMQVIGLVAPIGGRDIAPVRLFFTVVGVVAAYVACFRVARILRSDFARTGRALEVSNLATFFLGFWYLQYKINQAAVTPVSEAASESESESESEDDELE